MTKWKLYVVPHTHWDKEWYFTKQDSDVLLLNNFENIIEQLEKNPQMNFTLDGQVSIVEDYLFYHPEKKSILQGLIEKNQLIIGPWYTQPDFFNSTSETIIRNLLVGINYCLSFSKKYLNVAYVPDSFGHNDQMPQIYNKFGLKGFIYWRGISKKILEEKSLINFWKGIDGSEILSYNLLYGYWSFGANFAYAQCEDNKNLVQAKTFLQNVNPLIEKIKFYSKGQTNKILIPLGGDQAPIAKKLLSFIKNLNEISDDEWSLSSYENFIDDLKLDKNNFKTIENELKKPYMSRIHRTIGSQRQDIKKLLKEVEIQYYQSLQPLLINYYNCTQHYPTEIDQQIIKKILSSVAHDSLGGCNSDRTNSDIKNRLCAAQDLIKSLQTKVMKTIANNLKLNSEEIIIYNSHFTKCELEKEITVFAKINKPKLLCEDGRKIDFEIIETKYHDSGMIVKASANGESVSKGEGFYELKVFIKKLFMEPQEIVKIKLKKEGPRVINSKLDLIKIQNDELVYKNNFSLKFFADEDLGDSYDFSPSSTEPKIINKLIKVKELLSKSSCEQIFELTYSLRSSENSKKQTKQKIIVRFLQSNNEKVFVKVSLTNLVTQVRWRLVLIDHLSSNEIQSDQCYSLTTKKENEELNVWREEGWKEAPVNVHSFESILLRSGGTNIYTSHANEFENLEKNTLAITLFRSVASLGRNNLVNRPGRASGTSEFNIQTNDSKFLNQKLEWDFCFEKNKNNNFISAQSFITPIVYYQQQSYNNLFQNFDRFLLMPKKVNLNFWKKWKVNNANFIIKTIKLAEKGSRIIIRGYNACEKDLELKLFHNDNLVCFEVCDLLENSLSGPIQTTKIKHNEIFTIKIIGEEYDR